MITVPADRLVEDYLRRLEEAAAPLRRSRREELVGEIREHLEAALADADADDEVAVRNALERLGPPEEIVRAADDTDPGAAAQRSRVLEIAALVLLVVPGFGWLPGIVLVALSRIWWGREKLLGIALAVAPAVLFFLMWNVGTGGDSSGVAEVGAQPSFPEEPFPGETESSVGPLEIFFLVLTLLSGLPSVLYLGWRLRART